MQNCKEDNANMIDKFTRKASSGKFRVSGHDPYDYDDYFIDEFNDLDRAIDLLKEKISFTTATPTSYSDWIFIYNDKNEALYKGTFDGGVEKY